MNNRDKLVDLLLFANETFSISGRELDTDEVNDFADFLDINDVVVQRWISVEERLPGERGNYLVRCYFHNPGSTYTYENIKIIHFRGKTKWATENEYITHWMPLPEPPKEE